MSFEIDKVVGAMRFDGLGVSRIDIQSNDRPPKDLLINWASHGPIESPFPSFALDLPVVGEKDPCRSIWLSGFPLRSNACEQTMSVASMRGRGSVAFPAAPIRIGVVPLLLNALFFGGVLSTPIACRSALRTWRRRHGRCESCSYLLVGLETCPECGARNRSA